MKCLLVQMQGNKTGEYMDTQWEKGKALMTSSDYLRISAIIKIAVLKELNFTTEALYSLDEDFITKNSAELKKLKGEIKALKSTVKELETVVTSLRSENQSLKSVSVSGSSDKAPSVSSSILKKRKK